MAKKGLLESIVSDMLGEGSVSTGDFLDTIEDALSDLAGNEMCIRDRDCIISIYGRRTVRTF